MYVNEQNVIIEDNEPVTVGRVNYPRNWDKSTIPGLTKVTETAKPTADVITGFTVVDGVQVWQSRDYNEEEVEARRDKRTYREKRKDGYIEAVSPEKTFETTVGDALDALFDYLAAKDPDILSDPKLGPLLSKIATVKADNPKP